MLDDLQASLAKAISEETASVLTAYRLGTLLHRCHSQIVRGHDATTEPIALNNSLFDVMKDALLKLGILRRHPNLPNRAYRLFGRKDEAPSMVACTVDPFCYVSHLSAMEHHGLTNRMSAKLFLSTPPNKEWQSSATTLMQKDLGDALEDYLASGLPRLNWRSIARVGKTEIHFFHTKHLGAFKLVRDTPLRVATIGRTFHDMLRNPELCGGMHHVLEVYKEHAQTWLPVITGEIDRHGAPIDKVRAGYILDERLGLKSPVLDSWVVCAQRGGSRKLDASAEYQPVWSEKWCLSLNLE